MALKRAKMDVKDSCLMVYYKSCDLNRTFNFCRRLQCIFRIVLIAASKYEYFTPCVDETTLLEPEDYSQVDPFIQESS